MCFMPSVITFEAYSCGEDVDKKRNPITKSLIYCVETGDVAVSRKTSIKTVYMLGKDATLALKTEPWIVDTVSSLPMVHS